MRTILFCLLTILLAFTKFAEPSPKFLSVHGDINFIVKSERFQEDLVVGHLFDDADGGFILTSALCTEDRKGYVAFQTKRDCTVTAKFNMTNEVDMNRGFERRIERDFPEHSTGSSFFVGLYDEDSPVTVTFAPKEKAFRFKDIRQKIDPEESDIYCNDKGFQKLFGIDRRTSKDIIFWESDSGLYDRTMHCAVRLVSKKRRRVITARLVKLIISNVPDVKFSFQSFALTTDQATLKTVNGEPSEITAVQSTFDSHFIFYTDLTETCGGNVTLKEGEYKSSVISFEHSGFVTRMPAIHTVESLMCGIQLGYYFTYEYWCDCVRSVDK